MRLVMLLAAVALAAVACADAGQPPSTAMPGPSTTSTPGLLPTPPPTPVPAGEALTTATIPAEPAGEVEATPTAPALPVSLATQAALLYEREGAIWSLESPASQARLLVPGPAGAQGADGLWALAPGGQLLAVAQNPEGQPARLAVLALPAGRLAEVGRFDGRIDGLRWSHDSSRLAFLVNRRHAQTGELLEQELRLFDAASGSQAVLFQQRFRPEDAARQALWLEAWAPGDQSLYVDYALEQSDDPGRLYALSAKGGEPRLVSPGYLLKGGQAICALTSEVLLRQRAADPGAQRGQSPVFVARAALDGSLSGIRLLSPEDWFVGAVAWSPEGQQVAVERLEAQAHGTFAVHLWLLALDGRAPRQLTTAPAYREERPVWTPDGQDLVFERWGALEPEPAGLWVLRPGAEPQLLDRAGARAQASTLPILQVSR